MSLMFVTSYFLSVIGRVSADVGRFSVVGADSSRIGLLLIFFLRLRVSAVFARFVIASFFFLAA